MLTLVNPGQVSPHLHQIAKDLPVILTCTTGRFVEAKVNYWTAVLYFKHPNGSFIRVRLLYRDRILENDKSHKSPTLTPLLGYSRPV